MLPFLFILVTSLGLGLPHLQDSDAGTENPQLQQESNASDSSDDQRQDSPDTDTEEASNFTSSTPGPEAVTTTPSDLAPGNQTSNQSEEMSKPQSNVERQLSSGLISDLVISNPPYKVKVIFDSMTVHNDHEGTLSGDGEYDIAAYVQGIKVGLTDTSGPGAGLWDVSSGETVTFDLGTEVTIDIPDIVPLSILTVGSEVDGCDRTVFPESIQDKISELIASSPVGVIILVTQLESSLEGVQDRINSAINWVGCKLNSNDILGVINKAYEPTAYGAGSHVEKSDKGDFTLRYTIIVTAPQTPEQKQTDLGPKVSGQLNNDLQILKPEAAK